MRTRQLKKPPTPTHHDRRLVREAGLLSGLAVGDRAVPRTLVQLGVARGLVALAARGLPRPPLRGLERRPLDAARPLPLALARPEPPLRGEVTDERCDGGGAEAAAAGMRGGGDRGDRGGDRGERGEAREAAHAAVVDAPGERTAEAEEAEGAKPLGCTRSGNGPVASGVPPTVTCSR